MEELTDARAVVERLGGIKAVAELTQRKYTAAANWPAFNKFPPNTFFVMQEALKERRCKAPASLWGMVAADEQERRAS